MSDSDVKKFIDANRVAWNEAEPHHRSARFENLLRCFSRPGYNYLSQIETRYFIELKVQGKAIVQLACNNGRDILSVRNMGAGRCVGFDISEAFIEQGKALARAAGIDCELVASDVYEIPSNYDGQFDLAFISKGALIVMPDLIQLFAVTARLLKSQGRLFIFERHPILDMFNPEEKNEPPVMTTSYFRTEPIMHNQHYNYWTKSFYDGSPMYAFHHKLSDVIGACLSNGFQLIYFKEYPFDVSEAFAHFQQLTIKPPLSYALVLERNQGDIDPAFIP